MSDVDSRDDCAHQISGALRILQLPPERLGGRFLGPQGLLRRIPCTTARQHHHPAEVAEEIVDVVIDVRAVIRRPLDLRLHPDVLPPIMRTIFVSWPPLLRLHRRAQLNFKSGEALALRLLPLPASFKQAAHLRKLLAK